MLDVHVHVHVHVHVPMLMNPVAVSIPERASCVSLASRIISSSPQW